MAWQRERRFRQAFLAAYRSPFGIQRIGQSWITVKHPKRYLSDSMVRKHLNGDYFVGASGRAFTRTVTVDLDNHNGQSREDVLSRTQAVIRAVGKAQPLVTTTPRGGTHANWFLSETTWTDRARAFIVDQLEKSDIRVSPGDVEVFPHGRKLLRLPLGRDCLMLDPESLEPIGDRRVSKEALDWLLKYDKFDRLEIPDTYNPTTVLSKIRDQKAFNRPAVSPFMREIDDLLFFGLPGPSTRNNATLKLNWFLHVILGHDPETVAKDLREWIDEGHNGYSRDYNRSPRIVYAHIDRVVANFDWNKVGHTYKQGDTVALGQALEFLRSTPLNDRERGLLAHIIEYASKRGEQKQWGYKVRIPSRTLKGWDWQYGIALNLLLKKRYLQRGRNYTTLGLAQTYHVLTLPQTLNRDKYT